MGKIVVEDGIRVGWVAFQVPKPIWYSFKRLCGRGKRSDAVTLAIEQWLEVCEDRENLEGYDLPADDPSNAKVTVQIPLTVRKRITDFASQLGCTQAMACSLAVQTYVENNTTLEASCTK